MSSGQCVAMAMFGGNRLAIMTTNIRRLTHRGIPAISARSNILASFYSTSAPTICAGLRRKDVWPSVHYGRHVGHGRRQQHGRSTDNVLRSEYWLDDLPNADIVSTMFRRFPKWGCHTAIVCKETGRSYKYGELEDCSLRLGAAFKSMSRTRELGCVAILSPNVPEYPIMVFGALAVGGTVTTVSSALTPAEIATQLKDSDVQVVVVDPSLEATLAKAVELMGGTTSLPAVMVNGPSLQGGTNLLEIVRDKGYAKAERVENSPDKVAIIPYSSGTTGKPKGVCLPHKSLSNYLKVFTHPAFFPVKEATTFDQETSIGLMPFYHGFGLFVLAFSSLYFGTKIICLSKFSPLQYAEIIEEHEVRVLHIVPSLLNFLAHSPLVLPHHLASVRHVLIAAAPVHPAVARAFKTKAHHAMHFQEGLGLTETLGLTVTPLSEERIGYCGKLLPNHEARVVDIATGDNQGPDEPGELWVRGPGFLSHYHNNPLATAAAFSQDGWFKTGDVVTCSPDGFFSVVDRIKELIKVKGAQVSPTELEELILQVPAVAEAGVVGIPDARAGEVPRAYVVLKTGTEDLDKQDIVRRDIHELLSDKVARYKQLVGGVVFVAALPKNPTGKLMRKQLKEMGKLEQ